MSDAIWDGIILGAGHNALVLQAYLGKAGLRTLCLERGATAGGGLVTGLPGYNCAQVLHADLGLEAQWAPEPAAKVLARMG